MDGFKFHVGDYVQVRDWDDMEAEYGLQYSFIDTPVYSFVDGMKHLCGRCFHISEVCLGDFGKRYFRSFEEIEEGGTNSEGFWYITDEMIKPVEDDSDETEACIVLSDFESILAF